MLTEEQSTPDSDTDDREASPRDFAAFLLELAKGRPHRELSEALAEVSKAVVETGKAGKLQLTLQIKQQKGVDGAVLITDDIKKSVPRYDRPATIFYAGEDGELTRSDPHQQALY